MDPYRSAGNGSLTDADLVELDARLERFDVELVTTTTNRRPPAPTTPTAVFAPEFFTPAPALGSLTLEPSSPDPNR